MKDFTQKLFDGKIAKELEVLLHKSFDKVSNKLGQEKERIQQKVKERPKEERKETAKIFGVMAWVFLISFLLMGFQSLSRGGVAFLIIIMVGFATILLFWITFLFSLNRKEAFVYEIENLFENLKAGNKNQALNSLRGSFIYASQSLGAHIGELNETIVLYFMDYCHYTFIPLIQTNYGHVIIEILEKHLDSIKEAIRTDDYFTLQLIVTHIDDNIMQLKKPKKIIETTFLFEKDLKFKKDPIERVLHLREVLEESRLSKINRRFGIMDKAVDFVIKLIIILAASLILWFILPYFGLSLLDMKKLISI